MPYPLRGMRVIITVLWLAAIDTIVMLALYLQSVRGGDARHPRTARSARISCRPLRRCASAMWRRARGGAEDSPGSDGSQMFCRTFLRQHARNSGSSGVSRGARYLGWSRFCCPSSWLSSSPSDQTPELILEVLLLVAFTPPFMAAFVAATTARSGATTSDAHGLSPFIATRPLTNGSLIAARMKAMIRSALAAWMLVLVATPLALRLSGAAPVVMERVHRFIEVMGMPRAIAILLWDWRYSSRRRGSSSCRVSTSA